MNEFSRIASKETITSLEVAELTNKEHKNILADIRDEVSKLGKDRGRLIFQPIEYLDNRNRKQPAFNITLDGVLQLGARYDAVIRFNLIQKVNELQNKIKAPTTMKEALLLALEQQEKIEMLELKVIEEKQELVEKLIDYQLHCKDILADEFFGKREMVLPGKDDTRVNPHLNDIDDRSLIIRGIEAELTKLYDELVYHYNWIKNRSETKRDEYIENIRKAKQKHFTENGKELTTKDIDKLNGR